MVGCVAQKLEARNSFMKVSTSRARKTLVTQSEIALQQGKTFCPSRVRLATNGKRCYYRVWMGDDSVTSLETWSRKHLVTTRTVDTWRNPTRVQRQQRRYPRKYYKNRDNKYQEKPDLSPVGYPALRKRGYRV